MKCVHPFVLCCRTGVLDEFEQAKPHHFVAIYTYFPLNSETPVIPPRIHYWLKLLLLLLLFPPEAVFGRETKSGKKENIEEKSGKKMKKWLFGVREEEREEKKGEIFLSGIHYFFFSPN